MLNYDVKQNCKPLSKCRWSATQSCKRASIWILNPNPEARTWDLCAKPDLLYLRKTNLPTQSRCAQPRGIGSVAM